MRTYLDGKFTYSAVNVTVNNLTNGSVIVAFLLTIDGTTLSIPQLVAAFETVSTDGKIGNFTAEQIQGTKALHDKTRESLLRRKIIN